MPASALQLLHAGITSARDLGGPLEASINVRDAIHRGDLAGPTLYVSGPFIQHAPYPGTDEYRRGVDGPEADIVAVRGDVLRHTNLLQDVDIVVRRGVRYR
jgi:imidazolonepropionase-like amidohydrolase